MKKLLLLILLLVTVGSRLGEIKPFLHELIESLTWVVVLFSVLVYTKNDRWVIGLLFVLPAFFNDLLILIDPQGFNQLIRAFIYSAIAVGIGFVKSPKEWSY